MTAHYTRQRHYRVTGGCTFNSLKLLFDFFSSATYPEYRYVSSGVRLVRRVP